MLALDAPAYADTTEEFEAFADVWPRLFGIAYRVLGNPADAEDIVQDAWVRWQTCDRSAVRDPGAFLATITRRLALDVVGSARVRHELLDGGWQVERGEESDDVEGGAERSEALERALLLLTERLSPSEQAAYVLRQAFDYPYRRISEILDVTEPSARQLVSRAHRRLVADDRRAIATAQSNAERRTLRSAFTAAARTGDFAAIEHWARARGMAGAVTNSSPRRS